MSREQLIVELRERARAALGERFAIQEFHNTVLGAGIVPLVMFETIVDEWRATKAQRMAGYKKQMSGGMNIPAKFIGVGETVKPHPDLFWKYVALQEEMSEVDRLTSIKIGLSMALPASMRDALNMSFTEVAIAGA